MEVILKAKKFKKTASNRENADKKAIRTYENKLIKKISLPLLNDAPCRVFQREKGSSFKCILHKIRLKKYAKATISKPDSTYGVAYLGNVITGWAKGEGCIEKPLTTLWRNYTQSSRPDVSMQLTVSGAGLRVITKNHGLTEYWSHRITTCVAPQDFPRVFCWIYRHEGRRSRHELRCHAVMCSSAQVANQIEKELKNSLTQSLIEFKKDKLSKQNARLSLVNSVYEHRSLPKRKLLLSTGSQNYKPPIECSKSAPKLSSIEEILEEGSEDAFNCSRQIYAEILRTFERSYTLLEQRKHQWTYKSKKKAEEKEASPLGSPKVGSSLSNSCESLHHSDVDLSTSSDSERKLDIDFKIGGAVLPALKKTEKKEKDGKFVNTFISKNVLEQEQVSLVPVGESQSDFSSLKVYKKKTILDGNKDLIACTIYQLEEAEKSDDGAYEEECCNKFNAVALS